MAQNHYLVIRQENIDTILPPIPAKNAGMDGAPASVANLKFMT
jgi:hypothetical protein